MIGAVVVFGSEQLTKGNERRGVKVMGEATSGSYELNLGGMHNQHSPKCQAECYSVADM